jgi:hypothetical protein
MALGFSPKQKSQRSGFPGFSGFGEPNDFDSAAWQQLFFAAGFAELQHGGWAGSDSGQTGQVPPEECAGATCWARSRTLQQQRAGAITRSAESPM